MSKKDLIHKISKNISWLEEKYKMLIVVLINKTCALQPIIRAKDFSDRL